MRYKTIKTIVYITAISIGICSNLFAQQTQQEKPTQATVVEKKPPEIKIKWEKIAPHPRIMLNAGKEEELLKKIEANPHIKTLHDLVLSESNKMMKLKPVERKMIGKRLLSVSREALKRIFYWSYAYRMTKDENYAKRAEQEMLAICDFSDWNPSHYLDVGEICVALGIGYDWLHDKLPEESKEKIRTALFEKGILPSGNRKHSWWLRSENNWNQVCNAGMIYAALALYDNDSETAKEIIERSVKSNQISYEAYKPDGVYPEGFGYWHYGSGFQALLVAALESAFGKNSKLYNKRDGFLESAKFLTYSIGSSGKAYNFADNGEATRCFLPPFPWFVQKAKDKSLYKPFASNIAPNSGFRGTGRELPMAIIYGADVDFENIPTPKEKLWTGNGIQSVVLVRTNWEPYQGLYLGFKGGKANAPHAHMDAGSFVFDMDGIRWGIDLNCGDYNHYESRGVNLWDSSQKSDRWALLRYRNLSHNTISINGNRHNANEDAPIVEVFNTPEKMGAKVDMTKVLNQDLKSAFRECAIIDEKYLQVIDTVQTKEKPATLRWNFATRAKIKIINEGKAIELSDNGKFAILTMQTEVPFEAKVFPTTPEHKEDMPLRDEKFTGFEVQLPANSTIEIKTFIKPLL